MFKWFPGHMHKGRKAIDELKKRIDVVIDVRDARAPQSTENLLFQEHLGTKPRLIVMNKTDLADPCITKIWQEYFKKKGNTVLLINALNKTSIRQIIVSCMHIAKRSYRPGRPITAMIVGVPNVGKSTLMNALVGRKIAPAGNLPALTRAPQRVAITPEFELFDMPGILDPNPQDEAAQYRLALIAAMRDTVIDYSLLGTFLIEYCQRTHPRILMNRYHLPASLESVEDILSYLAERYGKQQEQGVGALIVQDFREGRLGRLSLERPPL